MPANDTISVARYLSAWAEEPDLPFEKRQALETAIDMIRALHHILNAKPAEQKTMQ